MSKTTKQDSNLLKTPTSRVLQFSTLIVCLCLVARRQHRWSCQLEGAATIGDHWQFHT